MKRFAENSSICLGRVGVFCFCICPCFLFEDDIAAVGEALALKYNPGWSGAGETMRPIEVPACYRGCFDVVCHEEYPLRVYFTRESWKGRLKSCRGVGFSLSDTEIAGWEREHVRLLERIAPPEFGVRHYGAIVGLKKRG